MQNRYSGFTLLEVLTATFLLSLLVTAFYVPRFETDFRSYQTDLATRTGEEIYQLGVYAQNFVAHNHGVWPDATHNCYNAINTMQSSGFLPAGVDFTRGPIPSETPLKKVTGLTINPSATVRAGYYYTDCRANIISRRRDHFRITYIAPPSQDSVLEVLQNQLPNTTAALKGTHNVLTTFIPLPAAVPIVEGLLPRDGSRAMSGDLDVGGHVIIDAENILLSNGASLANQLIDTIIVSPGTEVSKPNCVTGHTPVITLAPADIFLSNGAPVTRARVWAEDNSFWIIKSQVVGADGTVENDAQHIQVVATIACVTS